MSNRPNRDGRITNQNTRRHVRAVLTAMVERLGYPKTARYIDWNPSPLHAVIVDNDWTQRIVYPEDVTQIDLIYDIVTHYAEMSDKARGLTDELIVQANAFIKTARELRRTIRQM